MSQDPDWMANLLSEAAARKESPKATVTPPDDTIRTLALMACIMYNVLLAEFTDSKESGEDEEFTITAGALSILLACRDVAEPYVHSLPNKSNMTASDVFALLASVKAKAPTPK